MGVHDDDEPAGNAVLASEQVLRSSHIKFEKRDGNGYLD